jgi:DNA-binding CsgD family transcriptional regulator
VAPQENELAHALASVRDDGPLWDVLDKTDAVGELLARVAAGMVDAWGLERAVLLDVDGARVLDRSSDEILHAGSEQLRERMEDQPLVVPGRIEPGLRAGDDDAVATVGALLAERLGLGNALVVGVAPGEAVVALLVLDRGGTALEPRDRARTAVLAEMLGRRLRQLALSSRIAAAHAGIADVRATATALSQDAEPTPRPVDAPPRTRSILLARLTPREAEIALLLTDGLSNREIAEQLGLSPETVKANVRRILRKLGAANRVAVASLLASHDA